jgi:general stress protein 26
MDASGTWADNDGMTHTTTFIDPTTLHDDADQARRIQKSLARRSFCVLATTSPSGWSHASGVLYQCVDGLLYVHTMRSSRKARNIAGNGRVGVVVPVRKVPAGPPFNVQFQAFAEVLDMDAPAIVALLQANKLNKISGHGALDEPDGCFVRITPNPTVHSYGIGVSLIGVIKDPLHSGARSVRLAQP